MCFSDLSGNSKNQSHASTGLWKLVAKVFYENSAVGNRDSIFYITAIFATTRIYFSLLRLKLFIPLHLPQLLYSIIAISCYPVLPDKCYIASWHFIRVLLLYNAEYSIGDSDGFRTHDLQRDRLAF